MKKTLLSVIFGLSAFSAFAGGVENKSNMSTGYLRNPSRNAECERPEAAFYNIAGTAFLNEGLYNNSKLHLKQPFQLLFLQESCRITGEGLNHTGDKKPMPNRVRRGPARSGIPQDWAL